MSFVTTQPEALAAAAIHEQFVNHLGHQLGVIRGDRGGQRGRGRLRSQHD
jgi:hypothetical protein